MASTQDPDLPPSFPMPGSAQIASGGGSGSGARGVASSGAPPSSSSSRPTFSVSGPKSTTAAASSSSSPPPQPPSSKGKSQALRNVLDSPPRSSSSSLMPPPTAKPASSSSPSSSLMPPPSTSRLTAPPGVGGAPPPPSQTLIPGETSSKRKKVVLAPGRSPLDWARVKSSNDPFALREGLIRPHAAGRIPLSEVKKHKTRESAWTILNGLVYNMTPYLEYHPGGEAELMRVAGRDGTRLFMLTHSWVNIEAMIDGCCLGMVAMDA